MHFLDKMDHLFFLKLEALRSESVNAKDFVYLINILYTALMKNCEHNIFLMTQKR